MKRMDIQIPIYNWNVTIVTIYDKDDEYPIKKLLNEFEIIDDDAIDNVINERYNGGETYVNAGSRKAVLLIYKYDSINTFHNIINHEKRHLIDRIGDIHLIRDEKEAIAYLDGYVSEQIYSNLDKLI